MTTSKSGMNINRNIQREREREENKDGLCLCCQLKTAVCMFSMLMSIFVYILQSMCVGKDLFRVEEAAASSPTIIHLFKISFQHIQHSNNF